MRWLLFIVLLMHPPCSPVAVAVDEFRRSDAADAAAAAAQQMKRRAKFFENVKHFGAIMAQSLSLNHTLLDYFFPRLDGVTASAMKNWIPCTENCELVYDAYCPFVDLSQEKADISKALNPKGFGVYCFTAEGVPVKCHTRDISPSCKGIRHDPGVPCLYTDLPPSLLFAIITTARLAGITHIIEDGRAGGLSAFMLALHGFRVTSVERSVFDPAGSASSLRHLARSLCADTHTHTHTHLRTPTRARARAHTPSLRHLARS